MRVIQEITADKIGRIIDEFVADREEKKTMRNHEKFAQQLEQAEPKDRACAAAALRGVYCHEEWNDVEECYDCMKESMAWLYEKAEAPKLLKNGDGLKPGDEIMVRDRDCTAWGKCQFIGYFNGLFFVATPIEDRSYGWRQARLPEKGE